MKKRRFSKALVIEQLDKQINHGVEAYGFHDRTGWDQVAKKSQATNRAYGLWKYAVDLKQWIIEGSLE